MKQAIQLEIQWREAPAAAPSLIDRMELCVVHGVTRALPSLILFAKTALCVAFAFGMIFFAALIGG